MTAAVTIVKRALNIIGAHSEVNPADPELLAIGLESLIDLLNELTADEIDIGATVPTVLADDLGEDRAAKNALQYVLAERLAPICRVPVPPGAYPLIRDGWQNLKQRFQTPTIPNIVPSRLLPRGQGSSRGQWPSNWFKGESLDDDSAA